MSVTIEDGRLTIIFGLDQDGDSAITMDLREVGPLRALGALDVARECLLATMVAEFRPMADDDEGDDAE